MQVSYVPYNRFHGQLRSPFRRISNPILSHLLPCNLSCKKPKKKGTTVLSKIHVCLQLHILLKKVSQERSYENFSLNLTLTTSSLTCQRKGKLCSMLTMVHKVLLRRCLFLIAQNDGGIISVFHRQTECTNKITL